METNFNSTFRGLSYSQWLKKLGISYLGNSTASKKEKLSLKKGCRTYMLYLAPYNMSGYQVCPNGKYCKDLCLNGSGQNKADELARGVYGSKINQARIKRTKLFFEDRELFMFLLIHELCVTKLKAFKENNKFAVRLNGTSDLSPVIFRYENKCILDIFKDVQFYDYTKVANRLELSLNKKNYDLTLSYNGYNWDDCEKFLNNGGKVAVVFEKNMPKKFHGFIVNDANNYDMRFMDNKGEICGLTFHRTASTYKDGKYIGVGDSQFIVKENNEYCEY